MIRHIVMWKLKPFAEGADCRANAVRMKEMLDGCAGIVPGMIAFESGIASESAGSTCDVVLDSTFESKSALEAYNAHPSHLSLKAFAALVRESRHCVDFDI